MSVARGEHTSTLLLDGRVLVAGGRGNSGTPIRSAEMFDGATESWTPLPDLNQPRAGHSALLLDDGRVLLAGGSRGADEAPNGEIYDPASDTFTLTGALVVPRFGQTAVKLADGRVLLAGGTRGGTATNVVEIYDPHSNTFTDAGRLATMRVDAAASHLPDGRAIICGGGVPPSFAAAESTEIYTPQAGMTPGPSMIVGRTSTPAVALNDGRVFLATGGSGSVAARDSAEIYDPEQNAFVFVGTVRHPRHFPTVTVLTDGRVLIAGGVQFSSGGRASAVDALELYDPVKGHWTEPGVLVQPRRDHAAVAISGQRALITGGTTGSGAGTLLASAEIFQAPPRPETRRRRAVRH
jgi:hypothetical protein